ncbi:uncharacterized protein LOC119219131 isoform X3 [Pungitius pungitius]|uniref:uncharacterized protein LOC119219131 isoform X3 n=1 Tax=Pungitius pungitius TaxID=134920 RepID=UPI001889588F|nr:uncharacterized protein LOC119219131 isoform X3 [Pungitius pungitius]
MNPSPHNEVRPQSAVLVATLVVLNMIWWMIMIAAIGLGATHLSLCPVESNIPIYLIALGVTNLLALSLTYTQTTWGEGMVFTLCSTCTAILHLISFGLFFAGNRLLPGRYSFYGATRDSHEPAGGDV